MLYTSISQDVRFTGSSGEEVEGESKSEVIQQLSRRGGESVKSVHACENVSGSRAKSPLRFNILTCSLGVRASASERGSFRELRLDLEVLRIVARVAEENDAVGAAYDPGDGHFDAAFAGVEAISENDGRDQIVVPEADTEAVADLRGNVTDVPGDVVGLAAIPSDTLARVEHLGDEDVALVDVDGAGGDEGGEDAEEDGGDEGEGGREAHGGDDRWAESRKGDRASGWS